MSTATLWDRQAATACKSLYTLSASLQGYTLVALVFPAGVRNFGYAILIDGVNVAGSPTGSIRTLTEAAHQAKALFGKWTAELLTRV